MTPAEIIHQYGRWRTERNACIEAEDDGGPGACRWADSDDRAVELLEEAAAALERMMADHRRLHEWLVAERHVLLIDDPAWRETFRHARKARSVAMWDVMHQMRFINYDEAGA